MPQPRSFDEFQVGETASLDRVIRSEDVATFAALTGDVNPVHMDAEYAQALGLGDRVAHGMLTASFLSTVIGTMLPGPGALWLSEKFNFRAPVRIGDNLHLEVTVRRISKATRVLALRVEVTNQGGKIVLDGDAQVQVVDRVRQVASAKGTAETVVVTGSSRGIGAAIAKRLAADGLRVVVNYRRNETGAAETVSAIEANGGIATSFQADVTDPDQVGGLIAHADDRYGHVDVLVNNAGGPTDPRPLKDMTWKVVESHLNAHLRASFLCVEATLPGMVSRGFGKIINLTSEAAYGAPPGKMTGYVVAKAALAAYTKCLALEAGPAGVAVNAVAPGMTETAMVADVPPRAKLALAAQTPLRRLGQAEDVADVVSFLVGPGGSYLTGQTVHVSGGQYMS